MIWSVPRVYLLLGIIAVTFLASACNPKHPVLYRYKVKDNKRHAWVQKNDRIIKFKKTYKRNGYVEQGLKRAKPYLYTIRRIFKEYGLPPQLAYLPLLESGFRTDAVSRTGAKGMWQFTTATAKEYGLKVGWFRDDRLDWKKSTKAAAKYLDYLGKRFNYNWELALASYNGGPNYVKKAMKRQRSWNFWELQLRQETAEYVPKFFAILQVAKEEHPELLPRDFAYRLASN